MGQAGLENTAPSELIDRLGRTQVREANASLGASAVSRVRKGRCVRREVTGLLDARPDGIPISPLWTQKLCIGSALEDYLAIMLRTQSMSRYVFRVGLTGFEPATSWSRTTRFQTKKG